MQKMFSKKGAYGQDFGEYIINSLLEKGKNFYGDLSSLFRTDIEVRDGILLLNTAIILQNDNNSLLTTLREGLVYDNIRKALRAKKEVEKKFWLIKELVAKKLTALGLTISPAGLLVKGVYTRELFPRYDNEPLEWEDVVVSSTALIEEPTMALRSVSRDKPTSDGLKLDTVDFERLVAKSSNNTTEVLGSYPLEPSTPSSSSTAVESVKREAATLEPVTLKLVPSTPAHTLGRKREALGIYTSFGSSSCKARKTTTSSSLRKVVKVMECECNIAEPWKLKVVPAFWEELSFVEKLGVLEPVHSCHIYGPRLYNIPCSKHFKKLCSLLLVRHITS